MRNFSRALILLALFSLPCFINHVLAFPAKDCQLIIDREYTKVVREAIRGAQKSVQMMMFEASYYKRYPDTPSNLLIRELIAARKRGVKVAVILEQGESTDRTTDRNLFTGKLLAREGVDVTYDPPTLTTHTKLLVIDGETVIMGSTNWTYSALTKNHEVSVLIRSPEMAKTLADYFAKVKASGSKPK
ncbi:MAG TPA: phospholipase D-like domain-containing protein [Thermodesulfobacteriota bacterium]|nr:phospholipase D-like domain-containing protein [Thermodesulfobacteriota bacterium]